MKTRRLLGRLAIPSLLLGGVFSSCDETAVSVAPVAVVEVGPTSPTLTVGETVQLTVTLRSSGGHTLGGRAITWSSQPTSVATVSQEGLVTAVTGGNAVITARSEGATGQASILVNNPVPVVQSISPLTTSAGGSQFTLTVEGTGFVPTSVVQWDGSDRVTTFVSSTRLEATIPESAIAVGAAVQVNVSNPAPGGGSSSTQTLTVLNPEPSISSISPDSTRAGWAGFKLVVQGENFVPTSVIRWGGSERETTFVSDTELQTTILASDLTEVETVDVTVMSPTPGGGTSGTVLFVVEGGGSDRWS